MFDTSHIDKMMQDLGEGKRQQTSEGIFEHLAAQVREFESSLGDDYVVGALLASFGQAITLQVTNISYISPLLIIFEGQLGNGEKGRLIQNIAQLNFLLTKIPRANLEVPKRPIGFGTGD
jgi:hypothetical protein